MSLGRWRSLAFLLDAGWSRFRPFGFTIGSIFIGLVQFQNDGRHKKGNNISDSLAPWARANVPLLKTIDADSLRHAVDNRCNGELHRLHSEGDRCRHGNLHDGELHACPFQCEINDNCSDNYCDCCDDCRTDCADDI